MTQTPTGFDSPSSPPQRKRKNILLVILALIVSASGLLLYGVVASEGRNFMGGSKSGPAVVPHEPVISAPFPRREFFGGSKSGIVTAPRDYAPREIHQSLDQLLKSAPTPSSSAQD